MNERMNITVKFSKSAFKHGITKEDIFNVIINVVYDDILDEFDDKYLMIGFDGKGKLIEIIYHVIDNETICVFHAMKCRNSFIELLKK